MPSGVSRGLDCWVATGAARRRIGPFFKTPEGEADMLSRNMPRNIPEERWN